MKSSVVMKTVKTEEINTQQLEAIGGYTRRVMKAEELFVFSLILCDNEVDRDLERFDKAALDTLAALYLGKTGIFDHMPKAENQSARIFETKVEADGSKNTLGEDYCCLKAEAYMVKCEKNKDLILEIDGGIKKEVSVGCGVREVLCSVCGADQKKSPCEHVKGKSYGGVACHHVLANPTDAYEWSFVAVPAQRNAGIVKRYGASAPDSGGDLLEKLKGAGATVLNASEMTALKGYVESLKALAVAGEDYMADLRKEVVRSASVCQPEMDSGLIEELCQQMSLAQLKNFNLGYQKTLAKKEPLALQLKPPEEGVADGSSAQFKI